MAEKKEKRKKESEEEIRIIDSPIPPGLENMDLSGTYRYYETFNITVKGVGVFQPDSFPDEEPEEFEE